MFQTLDCFSLLLPQIRPLIPPDSSSLKMRFCNIFLFNVINSFSSTMSFGSFCIFGSWQARNPPPLEKTGFLKGIKCIGCHTGPYLDRKILQSSVPFDTFPSHPTNFYKQFHLSSYINCSTFLFGVLFHSPLSATLVGWLNTAFQGGCRVCFHLSW